MSTTTLTTTQASSDSQPLKMKLAYDEKLHGEVSQHIFTASLG